LKDEGVFMKNFKVVSVMLLGIWVVVCLTGFVWVGRDEVAVAGYTPTPSFIMMVDGKEVGAVKSAAKGLAIYDDVVEKLLQGYGDGVFVDASVRFKEAETGNVKISSENELAQAIEQAIVVKTNAYAVVVNGQKVCYVKDLNVAQEVLEEIKNAYVQAIQQSEDSQLQEAFFKEDISYHEEIVPFNQIVDKDKAISILKQGTEEIKEYEVKEGDTLWSIARAHGIPFSVLEQANAGMDIDNLRPGDKIKLTLERQLVTVVTKERQKNIEEIPFETEIQMDNTLEKGKTKVIKEGEKGQKEVYLLITKENGKEVKREVLEEKVIKEPVKKIVVKGTKVRPRVVTPVYPQPAVPSSESGRGSARGGDVVTFAMQYLGRPYVYGAEGPNAFDCSGFTYYVYRHFGIYLPRTAYGQRSVGVPVSRQDLAPGDLVLFSSPNHVGIYIGGGQFIHASSGSRKAICIDNLSSSTYTRRYVGARRVLN
jgi:LysM repeat protein